MNDSSPDFLHHDTSLKGIRGEVLSFHKDPWLTDPEDCYTYFPDGLVIILDGKIVETGEYRVLIEKYPDLANIDDYRGALIMPGFIDCHAHYVQSPMIGSFGDTLLEWLNQYAFPTESRFINKDFAGEVAAVFFRQLLSHGTTTANVFTTTFPEAVDAFFEESERYGTRMIAGKVLQDRNIPEALRDKSAEESVALTEQLMHKWHRRGRQLYAIIPRFAPTSTPLQLKLAGELYQKNIAKGVYLHTHLDEDENEIEWVHTLFPECPTYTDVYRKYGLLGPNSVFAHCCILKDEEWSMLHDYGCGAVHCPSSNLFLGDGEFKYWEAKLRGREVKLGMGTDVGGGTNFSIPRQLGEAYKVAMLRGRSIDALKAFYLATRGGAELLGLADKIGSISPGMEADITVIDLAPTEFAAWRLQFCNDIFQKLFVIMTLGLDNMVKATYVEGKKVYCRDRDHLFIYPS